MHGGLPMSVFIRLLGPIDICHDDTITAIGAPKRRAMLAALALSGKPTGLAGRAGWTPSGATAPHRPW